MAGRRGEGRTQDGQRNDRPHDRRRAGGLWAAAPLALLLAAACAGPAVPDGTPPEPGMIVPGGRPPPADRPAPAPVPARGAVALDCSVGPGGPDPSAFCAALAAGLEQDGYRVGPVAAGTRRARVAVRPLDAHRAEVTMSVDGGAAQVSRLSSADHPLTPASAATLVRQLSLLLG